MGIRKADGVGSQPPVVQPTLKVDPAIRTPQSAPLAVDSVVHAPAHPTSPKSAESSPQHLSTQAATEQIADLMDHPAFGEPNPEVTPAKGPMLDVAEPHAQALQYEVVDHLAEQLRSLPPGSVQKDALQRLEQDLGGLQYLAAAHYR